MIELKENITELVKEILNEYVEKGLIVDQRKDFSIGTKKALKVLRNLGYEITYHQLFQLASNGKIPCLKRSGRFYYFSKYWLNVWLTQGKPTKIKEFEEIKKEIQ